MQVVFPKSNILLRLTDSIAASKISFETPGIVSEESVGLNTSLSDDGVTGNSDVLDLLISGNPVSFVHSDTVSKSKERLEPSFDAKSVFDALIKECAGSRQGRCTAVDLRETLKAQGSHIRWIPHPLMPADSMTKAGPSAGNDALRHLPRTGKMVWDEETIRQSARLGRTKAVSRRQLETNDETVHGT